MRVIVLPPDHQHNSPRIQEIQLQSDLFHQSQPGTYGGAEEEEAANDQELGDEEYYSDFITPYSNKYPQYYTDLSIQKVSSSEQNPTIRLVPTRTIQKFTFLCKGQQTILPIDSGAEADCMTEAEVARLKLKILPLDKEDIIPKQADGISPLEVIGAVKTTFTRGSMILHFHGYVVKRLSQPILCGTPFISRNKLVQHIHKRIMMVGDSVVLEDPPFYPNSNLPFSIQQTNVSIQASKTDWMPYMLLTGLFLMEI